MKRDPVVIIIVAMVVSVMLIAGVYKSRRSSDQITAGPNMKGQQAPDFTLQSLDGKPFIYPIFAVKPCCSIFGRPGASPARSKCPGSQNCSDNTHPRGYK